jgi:two-component system NtrC family response regulator
MAKILIIDDDKGMCYTLSAMGRREGHEVECAYTLKDGIKAARTGAYDIVFLDVMLPDGSGLDVLPKIKKAPSKPEVIIMTAVGNPDGAELAIRSGAWDYIQKPFSIKEMKLPLLRALQYRQERLTKKLGIALKREGIIGRSPEIMRCLDLVAQAAGTDSSVLITGETGTGKELFARAIHENSGRSEKNFIAVDCAALPETLVESVLFGHEKGAFTGAERAHDGLVKQADGGTLFLDEVGELPPSVQKAFLRVLQERRFRPVGSKLEVRSDFRLIAATNRDLDEMVKDGKFRNDLVYRIRSIVVDLPPLRGRTGDIRDLAMHYMAAFTERYGMGTKGFSTEFFEGICAYRWPGNVRELMHALERALSVAGDEPTLHPVHLPTDIRVALARKSVPVKASVSTASEGRGSVPDHTRDLRELLEATERQYLQDLMSSTSGKVKEVCRISGLSRSRLYARLKKYGIQTDSND